MLVSWSSVPRPASVWARSYSLAGEGHGDAEPDGVVGPTGPEAAQAAAGAQVGIEGVEPVVRLPDAQEPRRRASVARPEGPVRDGVPAVVAVVLQGVAQRGGGGEPVEVGGVLPEADRQLPPVAAAPAALERRAARRRRWRGLSRCWSRRLGRRARRRGRPIGHRPRWRPVSEAQSVREVTGKMDGPFSPLWPKSVPMPWAQFRNRPAVSVTSNSLLRS